MDILNNQMILPLVSVISINYNRSDVTCKMLESLFQVTYPNIEVIIVDNGSPDDDPAVIKKRFPEVTLIESGENLGFAGGNNLGICISKGKYILLLNNDTIVTPGFIEPLVSKMEADPAIGAVSPKIRFYFKPQFLQFAGLTNINPYTVRSKGLGYMVEDKGQFDRDSLSAYAHGAAMMVSREVVEQVGLMSVAFFLYYEELDWGYRIRKAGYKIYYVHDSLVYHLESISTGAQSPLKTYYMERSRILYMRRNVRGIKSIIPILFLLLVTIPKKMTFFALEGKFDLLRAYSRAVGWQFSTIFRKFIHENPTC